MDSTTTRLGWVLASLALASAVGCGEGDSGVARTASEAIRPPPTQLPLSTTKALSAVTGSVDTRVQWSVSAGGGSIDGTGLYTAPATPGTFQVQAQCVADATKSAVAVVQVVTPGGSGTSVPAGAITTQSWNLAGSPYKVQGDVYVPAGNVLSIQPGVVVQFQGHYSMRVLGAISARGTSSAHITFTAADTTTGWNGLRIGHGGSGQVGQAQYVQYVDFLYGRKLGNASTQYDYEDISGGCLWVCIGAAQNCNISSDLNLSNSTFTSCNSEYSGGGAALILLTQITASNLTFTNNATRYTSPPFASGDAHGGGLWVDHGSVTITNSTFTGNSCGAAYPSEVGSGGAIYSFSSTVNVVSPTTSGNTPDDWGHDAGSTFTVD